jgi:Secretion system C-terminal sorting domain/HYR domain
MNHSYFYTVNQLNINIMRKIFTLIVLFFISIQVTTAQTIIKDEIRNFSELAAFELANPDLVKPCATCPKEREADYGLNAVSAQIMPFPSGANIKMSDPLPKKVSGGPVPDAPSRPPVQQWLGHLDVGSIIPPDTYGAVGLNHVVTATNNFIKVHAKVGGAQISQVTISGFTGVASTCDPQLFFDPATQRWIFVAIGCAGVNNPTILMTSNTSDPTGTWRTLTFVSLPGGLLDHPYLGYDDTKIVIGGRKFAGGTTFTGPDVYLIDKAAMLAGTPITFGTNAQSIVRTAADGDSPRPVTVYFPPVSNTGNPQPNTVYIVQSWNNTSLRLSTITGNIPACVWNTGAAVFPTAPGPEAWTAGNHGTAGSVTQQPPETRRLASNDARVSSAVMMNGKIWALQHCAFPAGASGASVTHTDVQYWALDGAAGTFGNVIQRGRSGAVAGEHRWFGAIAVNRNEDVLVGYSMSNSTTQWPSAAYSTRQASTPANTLDDPLSFHNGEGRYWKDFGSGRPRWGDYSQSHLDPVDNSLWTTQQYAATPAGAIPPDNNSRFGTWWAQVPPSTVTAQPIITAGTATLGAEGCIPNNSVIDPGETVTVSFCALNTGTANTTNLVGTMQVSGGVTPISGPQNYGVVTFGGPAVCRNFTFSNTSGTCGATITVSIQWQDGALNLGTTTWTFTLGTVVVASSENFDAVVAPALPAGWTATNVSGPAPLWVTSSTGSLLPVPSAPNSLFIDDPAVVSDKQITTPSFTPGTGARVSFAHRYQLETNFDGGVLEISINGGAYQDIITAGGSFVANGYTGVISAAFGNPLANRNAWSGTSGAFGTSTVNLPAASFGQPTRLKFRMGSDNSVSGVGWRVDNFSVSQPSCCGAACTITCPANVTANTGPGATTCGVIVNYPPATTTGLCGPVTYSQNSGTFFPVGTTTVTATAAAGPTCTFTITVTDNTPPVTTCPANITVNNAPGTCAATVNYPSPTVSDNCGLPGPLFLTQTASQTPVAGSVACNAGGFHTLNSYWRAYNLAPMGLPGPLTINSVQFGIELADANGTGTTQPVTVNVYTSAGAFPGGVRTLVGTSGVVQVPDQTLTTFTAPITVPPTVPANSILCVELVTPDGRAPANNRFFIGSNTSAQTGPSYIQAPDCGIATPTDLATIGFPNMRIILNVNGALGGASPLVQIAGLPSGSVFPVGVTTNTFRGTDIAGNTSTCSFTVTVNDNQAPALGCPTNITQNTDVGACVATVVTPNPTFSDNCAVTSLTWTITGATSASSPLTGINFVGTRAFNLNGTTGQGVSTVTYTARDAAGNTTTCSFTVTVNDAWIPVISGQPSNQFVCVGSNGAFTVTASVPAGNPLTYQWQSWTPPAGPWVNIPGATAATLPLPSVPFALNTTDYRCVLTGRCSEVISGFATLYVNPLPTISLLASRPLALLPGNQLTITAVASPSGGTYVWRKNGVVIAGATGSTLSNLTVDDIGSYTCTYTDGNGCVKTSNAMVVTGQPSDKVWLYPNPNTGVFQVRFFNATNEAVNIGVFNSAGQQVWTRSFTTGLAYTRLDVDISNLSQGEYTVSVFNAAGKKVGAKKFILVK